MTQLYLIERDFGGFTDAEITSAAYRGKVCAMYWPGMRWVRSFYDRTTQLSLCLYEAANAEELRRHSWAIVVPCEDVRPVVEEFPPRNDASQYHRLEPIREPDIEGFWLTTFEIPDMGNNETEDFVESLFAGPNVARVFRDPEKSQLLAVTPNEPKFQSLTELAKVTGMKWVAEVMPEDVDVPAELVPD